MSPIEVRAPSVGFEQLWLGKNADFKKGYVHRLLGGLTDLVIEYGKSQRKPSKTAKEEWMHSYKVGILLQTQL